MFSNTSASSGVGNGQPSLGCDLSPERLVCPTAVADVHSALRRLHHELDVAAAAVANEVAPPLFRAEQLQLPQLRQQAQQPQQQKQQALQPQQQEQQEQQQQQLQQAAVLAAAQSAEQQAAQQEGGARQATGLEALAQHQQLVAQQQPLAAQQQPLAAQQQQLAAQQPPQPLLQPSIQAAEDMRPDRLEQGQTVQRPPAAFAALVHSAPMDERQLLSPVHGQLPPVRSRAAPPAVPAFGAGLQQARNQTDADELSEHEDEESEEEALEWEGQGGPAAGQGHSERHDEDYLCGSFDEGSGDEGGGDDSDGRGGEGAGPAATADHAGSEGDFDMMEEVLDESATTITLRRRQ